MANIQNRRSMRPYMTTLRQLTSQVFRAIACFPFYSLSNALLRVKSRRIRRWFLFDWFGANASSDFLYTSFGREGFLVDRRDRVIGRFIFAQGEFEFEKFTVVLRLLQKHRIYDSNPKLLIDVGANIGPICIPAVARGYVERAIAIEPDPHNCRLLRANIGLNGLTDAIMVRECACGMTDDEMLDLALSEDQYGDHRIKLDKAAQYPEKRRIVRIKSHTIKTLCPYQGGQDALIWMDVQGYEGYVLAGCGDWLEAGTPLVLEFWPSQMKLSDSFELLKTNLAGYAGFYDLANPGTFRRIDDLDDLSGQIGDQFTDLLVLARSTA